MEQYLLDEDPKLIAGKKTVEVVAAATDKKNVQVKKKGRKR
jgi:hypothetical protein